MTETYSNDSQISGRILVVDDQPINIQVINKILSDKYQIFMATSGEQAIEFCLSTQPDMVLMDVMMPGMSGLETCQKMKQHADLANIPVLFVTALQQPDEEDACWEAGGVDFLYKPINPITLAHRVKAHLTLKLQADLLRSMAYLDGLTGINNRRYFDICYKQQLAQVKRSQQSLALLLIDIDYFKQYNDSCGHLAGDDCLKEVAQFIQATLHRESDIVARYGGEEFVCLLPDTDIKGATIVANELVSVLFDRNISHHMSPLGRLTISVGVAVWDTTKDDSESLTQLADEQLYNAKAAGRNRFCVSVEEAC